MVVPVFFVVRRFCGRRKRSLSVLHGPNKNGGRPFLSGFRKR